MPAGARVAIGSGAGRFADPWHPFDATTRRLADLLEEAGLDVTVSDDVDGLLADLAGVDLLVLNIGAPDPAAHADAAAGHAITGFLAAGGRLLAMHSTLTAEAWFRQWPLLLGAVWIDGVSMHPPYGEAEVTLRPGALPGSDATGFRLQDERYSRLRVLGSLDVLVTHTLDGVEHPLVWLPERGGGRVAVDALGHDVASYDSAEHRALLTGLVRRLLSAPGG